MKLLCDVHLPRRLVKFFVDNNIEAVHGGDILDGMRTKDNEFSRYADENNFVILTKDSDFKNTHFLQNTPKRLIKINLGNISNSQLIEVFDKHLSSIVTAVLNDKVYIEINKNSINVLVE